MLLRKECEKCEATKLDVEALAEDLSLVPKMCSAHLSSQDMCHLVMWRVNQVCLVIKYHLAHNLTTLSLAAGISPQSTGDSILWGSSF